MTYILTVYRAKGIAMQHHSYADMVDATRKAESLKGDRWVRKIELSVLLHTWRGNDT